MTEFTCSKCKSKVMPFVLNGIAYEFCQSCKRLETKATIFTKDWKMWEEKYMNYLNNVKEGNNKMKEVANILGLELNQEFIVRYDKYNERLRITERGIEFFIYRDKVWTTCDFISLEDLVTGKYQIENTPFKPQVGETYFYVSSSGGSHEEIFTDSTVWREDFIDLSRFYFGNCFITQTAADNNKDRIIEKLQTKYYEAV